MSVCLSVCVSVCLSVCLSISFVLCTINKRYLSMICSIPTTDFIHPSLCAICYKQDFAQSLDPALSLRNRRLLDSFRIHARSVMFTIDRPDRSLYPDSVLTADASWSDMEPDTEWIVKWRELFLNSSLCFVCVCVCLCVCVCV